MIYIEGKIIVGGQCGLSMLAGCIGMNGMQCDPTHLMSRIRLLRGWTANQRLIFQLIYESIPLATTLSNEKADEADLVARGNGLLSLVMVNESCSSHGLRSP